MKPQWIKAIVVVMVALFIAGCSRPISQIRLRDPYLTVTSTKSPKEVAKCIEMRSRSEIGSFWKATPTIALEEHPGQTYRVVLTIPGMAGLADLLVKPSGNVSVIEYRRDHGWASEKQFLEIIEQCAR